MTEATTLGALKKLIAPPDVPDLGPGPRATVQSPAQLNRELDGLFRDGTLAETNRELIRATVLLWHDHLDAAHAIVQQIENADGSYLHAILHRREPDYGNAKYWFHRVGKHPCFPELASKAAALLRSKNQDALLAKLVPGGEWDPFALVDACERAAGRADSDPLTKLLREIQAVEFELMLERVGRVSNG